MGVVIKRMIMEEKQNRVWIGGKLITLSELQQQFDVISTTGTKSSARIIEVLANADKPLTRKDIANRVKITNSYAATVLKNLIKRNLVLTFDVKGSNYMYYVLTEKGYNLSKTLKKE